MFLTNQSIVTMGKNKNMNHKPKLVKKFKDKVKKVHKNVNKVNKNIKSEVVLPGKKVSVQKGLNVNKLSQMLNAGENSIKQPKWKDASLRERMWLKLKSARFRYLNQEMYTKTGEEAKRLFKSDPEAFKSYHDGYKTQVSQWPINPLDVIIKSLKSLSKDLVIADFGCGEAKLSISVPQTVHSFDLVALNSRVTVCDMSKTPLNMESVDVAVFCLSLMGTNLQDYLIEANRVLKISGILKIAEVESRFDKVDEFIQAVEKFGFKIISKDFSHAIFYFFEFKKLRTVKNRKKLPTVSLNPCLYKKR